MIYTWANFERVLEVSDLRKVLFSALSSLLSLIVHGDPDTPFERLFTVLGYKEFQRD